jgi:cell wall-associated NlpC family hydrolase
VDTDERRLIDEAFCLQAKNWESVIHVAQQSSRFGCDCIGLIMGAAKELHYDLSQWDVVDRPLNARDNLLLKQVEQICDRVTGEPEPGNLLTFTVGKWVQHCSIYAGDDQIIHTDRSVGRVVIINYPERLKQQLHGVYAIDWGKIK